MLQSPIDKTLFDLIQVTLVSGSENYVVPILPGVHGNVFEAGVYAIEWPAMQSIRSNHLINQIDRSIKSINRSDHLHSLSRHNRIIDQEVILDVVQLRITQILSIWDTCPGPGSLHCIARDFEPFRIWRGLLGQRPVVEHTVESNYDD